MKTGIATAPIASRPHCVIYLSYVDLGEERCGDILNCQQKKLMKKIGNCDKSFILYNAQTDAITTSR